jgi:hypothetical protein
VLGSQKGWHAAEVIISVVVLGACLPGCAVGEAEEDVVASQVKIFEDEDVEVTSCEEVGEAITRDSDYGASLSEAWRCSVDRPAGSGSAESCYTVYTELEVGVIGRLDCSTLGPGCPPGGRRVAEGNVFLGPIIDLDLVLARARGYDPPHRTIRVDVSYGANGAPEDCGYLDVQVPIDAEDPLELAAERAEAHGWSEDRYSLSSRSLDG